MAATTKYKPRKPTATELLMYGQAHATAKAATDPKVWAKFVKNTHNAGFSVDGQLSGAPAALRARTLGSLKHEAKSTVNTAYAPVTTALNEQERRLRALDSKRALDNTAYMAWLTNENVKINTAAHAADTMLGTRAQQIHDAAQASWAAVQPDALAAQQAQTSVSDPAQSATMADIAQAKARGDAQAESGLTENTAIRAAGASQNAMMDRAVLSSAGLAESKRKAEFDKGLTAIFDKRSSAKIDKAKDYLSTFGQLKLTEIDKASKVQDFNALADKLGVARDTLDLKALALKVSNANADADRTAREAAAALQAAAAAANTTVAQERLNLAHSVADVNSDGVVDGKDAKAKAALQAKYGGKTKGPSDSAKNASTKAYVTVGNALADLKRFTAHPELHPHTDVNGKLAQNYNDAEIAVAYDLYAHRGKLSKHGIKLAKQLGILNPAKLFGVNTDPPNPFTS